LLSKYKLFFYGKNKSKTKKGETICQTKANPITPPAETPAAHRQTKATRSQKAARPSAKARRTTIEAERKAIAQPKTRRTKSN
jgi:hypothetical protein